MKSYRLLELLGFLYYVGGFLLFLGSFTLSALAIVDS